MYSKELERLIRIVEKEAVCGIDSEDWHKHGTWEIDHKGVLPIYIVEAVSSHGLDEHEFNRTNKSSKGMFFMRKCLRCESMMVEDLEVMVSYGGYGLFINENGIFKKNLGKIICAVCPQCGYVETYIDNTYDIKKLVEKDK